MTPLDLQTLATHLYGPAWPAHLAADLGVAVSTARKWMVAVPALASYAVRALVSERTGCGALTEEDVAALARTLRAPEEADSAALARVIGAAEAV